MLRRSLLLLLATSAAAGATRAHADWFTGPTISGSGNVRSEPRDVGAFTGVALATGGMVEVRNAATDSVVVETDDNILPLIETVVENGTLQIRFKEKLRSIRATNLRFVVTARTIDALAVSGSGDIRAETLKSAALTARIAGSGDIRIARLDSPSLVAYISGSGDLTVGGSIESLSVSIAGSGNLKTGNLEAKRASVKIAGSGYAKVWARETLAVSIAGSGDVGYYGDAAVTQSVAGRGTIKRLGFAPG